MIVDNLDIVRIPFSPRKADTPPRIDTDTMLTGTITRQLLQVVRRRDAQI
jgi:hypothetical protein